MSMDNLSLSDIASVTRGNDDNFGGNMGFFWIFALLLLAGNGFGGLGGNADAVSNADLQRVVDLNSIQQGQANIMNDVQRGINEINSNTNHVAYDNLGEIRDVGSAVATGNANIINNLTAMQANMQNCCCETKQTIMENRYLDSQNASAIMANDTSNTQKILDAIAQNKAEALQQRVNQLELQNAVSGVVRYPSASTYYAGANPFCSGCSSF